MIVVLDAAHLYFPSVVGVFSLVTIRRYSLISYRHYIKLVPLLYAILSRHVSGVTYLFGQAVQTNVNGID